jgi:chemotaxis protein methyltransferase CheR
MDDGSALENERIELDCLLESIFRKYGYDFRAYSRSHVLRRLRRRLEVDHLGSLSELQHRVLYEESYLVRVLQDLSINVTEMFRDPTFYQVIRAEVLPVLKTYPFVKIWHAGCATGEEVYSMAILLREGGLESRCRIYATDFNEAALEKAKYGIYSLSDIRSYTANYMKSGGTESFSDYYTASYDSAIMNRELKKDIVFAHHNLVTDGEFGEMHLIVCRNVLIYFNRELQQRVVSLFSRSIIRGGFLWIGSKESLRYDDPEGVFEPVVESARLYRKRFGTNE